jgi:hypothetical protein
VSALALIGFRVLRAVGALDAAVGPSLGAYVVHTLGES